MRKLILFLIIGIFGCSRSPVNRIGGEFNQYVYEFASLSRIQIPPIIIMFDEIGTDGGQCQTQGQQKTIVISRTSWDNSCPDRKRGLIFHELGHCVMGRPHTQNQMSYMYPALQSCEFYMGNKQVLDFEMFHR